MKKSHRKLWLKQKILEQHGKVNVISSSLQGVFNCGYWHLWTSMHKHDKMSLFKHTDPLSPYNLSTQVLSDVSVFCCYMA